MYCSAIEVLKGEYPSGTKMKYDFVQSRKDDWKFLSLNMIATMMCGICILYENHGRRFTH